MSLSAPTEVQAFLFTVFSCVKPWRAEHHSTLLNISSNHSADISIWDLFQTTNIRPLIRTKPKKCGQTESCILITFNQSKSLQELRFGGFLSISWVLSPGQKHKKECPLYILYKSYATVLHMNGSKFPLHKGCQDKKEKLILQLIG